MEGTRSIYYENLSGDVKERYDEKIRKCGGIDPYTIKERDLSVNPKDFPEITILDIGKYLVHSISSYTKKKFSAYKSTEAYAHFESGFVLSIGSKKNSDNAILRGKVRHGQRMNESPLKVWILANMNGTILCAHCNCLSGLSETCSHVGAICYAISNFWESSETKSVTDFLCKWNVPSFKEESMTFVKNIRWKLNSNERLTLDSNFLTYCNSLNHFSDETIEEFLMGCHSDGNQTASGTILFPEDKRSTNIKDQVFLASLYSDDNRDKILSDLIDIGKSISIEISSDEFEEIGRVTNPRLKSKCRTALKRGRITGSNFKECCAANIDNPSITTINRIMNPIKNFGFTARHQIKNKKKALEQHFRSIALEHQNLERSECGLIINPLFPYFAASPDNLVSCDCHGGGCVVIKCLKIMESAESFEVLTRKPTHILNKNGDKYLLEKTHEYYYQAQLLINAAELKYCDFTIWSPTTLLIIRIDANIDFWTLALKKAEIFHERVMMPELLGKFYTRKDLPILMEEDEEDQYELFELEIELLNSIQDECIDE